MIPPSLAESLWPMFAKNKIIDYQGGAGAKRTKISITPKGGGSIRKSHHPGNKWQTPKQLL